MKVLKHHIKQLLGKFAQKKKSIILFIYVGIKVTSSKQLN